MNKLDERRSETRQALEWTCSRVPAIGNRKCDSVACLDCIDSSRSRCEEAEKQRDHWLECDHQHIAERDEARRWALKFGHECNRLRAQLNNVRMEREEAGQWADRLHKQDADLRAQLSKTEKALRFQQSVEEVRALRVADEMDDLCEERDEARNKALYEAKDAAWIALCGLRHKWPARQAVTDAILALKS